MPTDRDLDTRRPEALQTVSDADKAAAIAAVCSALAGQAVDARIEMVDYNGRLDPRGPFRQHSAIRFALFAKDDDASPDDVADGLQQVDDETLASAIAAQLGKLAGEKYLGYIAMKRIGARPRGSKQVADVRLLLAVS